MRTDSTVETRTIHWATEAITRPGNHPTFTSRLKQDMGCLNLIYMFKVQHRPKETKKMALLLPIHPTIHLPVYGKVKVKVKLYPCLTMHLSIKTYLGGVVGQHHRQKRNRYCIRRRACLILFPLCTLTAITCILVSYWTPASGAGVQDVSATKLCLLHIVTANSL
jgi:hypothetical protein